MTDQTKTQRTQRRMGSMRGGGPTLLLLIVLATGTVGCGMGGDDNEGPAGEMAAAAESGPAESANAGWQESFPDFTRHVIDDFQSGYQAIAFDVDGDGREDVAALSTGGSELVWYRNPGWERYTISTATERYINMAPHDIDGDGDLDLAVASEFSLGNSTGGGVVHWAEAPENPTEDQEWPLHRIDAVPTSHRLKWADIDGEGTAELINLPIVGVGASSPEYHGAVEMKAYGIPEDPTGPWPARVLDDSRLEVAHGIAVVDWDGDGADDLLTASLDGVHLFRPALEGQDEGEGDGPAVMQIAAGHQAPRPNAGSSEVALGTLGPEGRFLATNDPWHGNQVVIYRPGESGELPWQRRVIETDFEAGHAVVTVDLNGDGYDEVVAGHRGGEQNLFIYRYRPESDEWERIPLDLGGVAVSSLDVADLDGNGAPDILTIGGATDNVVWYQNGGAS